MLLVDMDPTAAAVEFISPAWSAAVARPRYGRRNVGLQMHEKNRAAVAAKPIVFDLINAHIAIHISVLRTLEHSPGHNHSTPQHP